MKKINKKICTGIKGLDEMLKGGLIPGRNILLSGPSGSGKSTIAMQFVYNVDKKYKEPSLYVTLEETREKLIEDMAKFGFDLKKAEAAGNFHLIGGPIAKLTSNMEKVDATAANIVTEIGEVIKEKKIKRVVIDSVSLLTMLMETDRERRKALAALANTLSAQDCTSILISETEEGTMKLSRYGIEEFIVDGVVVLYLIRQGNLFVPGIVIRKMRGSNHDKEIRVYKIADDGVTVYPSETMFGNV
ncbi:MAG: ATPase domain-containing protein [Candidatus Woesearchaeota archaeon]